MKGCCIEVEVIGKFYFENIVNFELISDVASMGVAM